VTYPKTVGEFCDRICATYGRDTPMKFTWTSFEGWRIRPYFGVLSDLSTGDVGLGIELCKDTRYTYDVTERDFYL